MKEETKNELKEAVLAEVKAVEEAYGNKVFAELSVFKEDAMEKIRLFHQRLDYLEGVSTPEHLEEKMDEVTDLVSKLQASVEQVLKKVKDVIDNKLIQCVTYEEMLAAYKMSGATLQDLADMIPCDVSAASRIINCLRNKGDIPLYHKIKQFCLEKIKADFAKVHK